MAAETTLEADLRQASLPSVICAACRREVPRRSHRVYVRPTWRKETDALCQRCWLVLVEAAAGMILLLQEPLPLDG